MRNDFAEHALYIFANLVQKLQLDNIYKKIFAQGWLFNVDIFTELCNAQSAVHSHIVIQCAQNALKKFCKQSVAWN